ncbi:MAG: response regulator [Deltaproteobacteria bacterium]|nr:response regulator [Deltaproteobacteria bacterium]
MKERKLLIIEDDPDHAELILDIFEAENVKNEVILMKDGQEVVDFLMMKEKSREQHSQADLEGTIGGQLGIGLFILDLNLPKVNGMDVLKYLKKNPKFSTIPVVVLSTSEDQKTIFEAYKNGANGYITKPVAYDEFVSKIESLIEYWFKTNTLPQKC